MVERHRLVSTFMIIEILSSVVPLLNDGFCREHIVASSPSALLL